MSFLQRALLRVLENHFQRGDLSALSDLGELMRGSHPSALQPTFMQPIPPSVLNDLSPGSPRPTYLSGLLEPGVSPGFSLKEYIQQLPQGPNPAFVQPTPPSVLNPAFIQPTFMQPIPPPIWDGLSPLKSHPGGPQLIPPFAWSDLSPLRPHRIGEFLRGFGRSG